MEEKNPYIKAARSFIAEVEQESVRRGESLEQFYRGFHDAICEMLERLRCAADELEPDIAAEVMRLPR